MRIVPSEKEWLENEIKIKQVMTRMPYTASPEASIFEAKRKMKELRIRHLPVLDRGELVGIISDRDVKTAETFHGTGYLAVGDAMSDRPFTVAPDEPLARVLEVMLERKIGSVLIMSPRGVVSGIFTANDALAMLRALVLSGERERDLKREASQGQQAA
jgi:acetoin utilization protein AcuB